MAHFYFDEDARVEDLAGRTISVFGYGNQGRSQALNLRDSGLRVIVANRDDAYGTRARGDGFEVVDLDSGAIEGDVLMMLLPDEIQCEVYEQHIQTRLASPKTLCFAHGYNIRFGRILPPSGTDVILVAPRMIGAAVRELFVEGSGVPAFVAVEQDASGTALPTALALARALGCTRAGALETTFAEETELDLLSEQVVWPVILRLFLDSFEYLVSQGYQPEAVLTELYVSGEPARVLSKAASHGLLRQGALHSRTSQFGTLSRMGRVKAEFFRDLAEQALEDIRSGSFAREWQAEQAAGFPRFDSLREAASSHPINEAEDRLHSVSYESSTS